MTWKSIKKGPNVLAIIFLVLENVLYFHYLLLTTYRLLLCLSAFQCLQSKMYVNVHAKDLNGLEKARRYSSKCNIWPRRAL